MREVEEDSPSEEANTVTGTSINYACKRGDENKENEEANQNGKE